MKALEHNDEILINKEKDIATEKGDFFLNSSNEEPIRGNIDLSTLENEKFLTKSQKIKKKAIDFFKKNFSSKTDLTIFLLFIASVILYLFALLPCDDMQGCYWGLGRRVYFILAVSLLCSNIIIFSILLYSIHKRNHYAHFIYIVPIYLIFFFSIGGINYINHGTLNAIVYIIFFLVLSIFYFIIKFFIFSFKTKRYYLIGIFLSVIAIIWALFRSNLILNYSCKNWDVALNGTTTDNDSKDYPCKLQHPSKNSCYIDAYGNTFDLTKLLGVQCGTDKERGDEYGIFSELLPKELKGKRRFGWPITTREKYGYTLKEDHHQVQKYIYEGIIDMDEYEKENQTKYKNEPRPEAVVEYDLKTRRGNLTLSFHKNETLASERKAIASEVENTGPYQNVLIIYLDGISRPNFFRKLKKTANYLERFTKYDTNIQTKNFSLFQFMKYNTLKPKTFPNIKPMFYGTAFSDKNGTNVVKYYKQKGFVTGHTGTTCGREIFAIKLNIDGDRVRYLDYDSYDHEAVSLFCDLNFINDKYPVVKGFNSYTRRCLYGEPVYHYAMEYTKLFWKAYPDNKKFFRIHINEGHDATNSLLSYLDEPLFNFMQELFEGNLLNDTFVMIMSDHGLHLPGPFYLFYSEDFLIERTLGSFFMLFPNDNRLYENGLYDILFENQQLFVTPYDIYDTLVHLAIGEDEKMKGAYSGHGKSLMKQQDYLSRYCESKVLNIKDFAQEDCKCKKVKK